MASPLDDLTEEQRAQLSRLSESVQYEKLTVSFSMDGRDSNNYKKGVLVSVTAGAKGGSWSSREMRIARLLVCKNILVSVYGDAANLGVMPKEHALKELQDLIAAYDRNICNLMGTP